MKNFEFITTLDNDFVPIYNIKAFMIIYISSKDGALAYLCGLNGVPKPIDVYYTTYHVSRTNKLLNPNALIYDITKNQIRCWENYIDFKRGINTRYITSNRTYLLDVIEIPFLLEEFDYKDIILNVSRQWEKQINQIKETQKITFKNNSYKFKHVWYFVS